MKHQTGIELNVLSFFARYSSRNKIHSEFYNRQISIAQSTQKKSILFRLSIFSKLFRDFITYSCYGPEEIEPSPRRCCTVQGHWK